MAGEAGIDVLFLPGWISQIEQLWEAPANRRFLERLGVFSAPDPVRQPRHRPLGTRRTTYTLEQEARDALAVLDAAGSERAALFTYALGGLVGVKLAAEHPERVGALVMYASVARTSWAPDYDWAMTDEQRERTTVATSAAGGNRTARCWRGWRRRWTGTRR